MRRLFRFRYPKIAGLVIASILAYLIFKNSSVQEFIVNLNNINYAGTFIAGLLFSFGFSTPFAIGFFLSVSPENIFLTSIIGGFGALLSDLFIFKMIHVSFMDEFNRIKKIELIRETNAIFKKEINAKIRIYFFYVFAGIIIASPLPDEIGVSMLVGLTTINIRKLAIVSLITNTIGIFTILLIGSTL